MAKNKIITSGRVHLEHDGQVITLRPGDTVPAWAEKTVTNPALFEGVEPPAADPAPEHVPVEKKTTRRKKTAPATEAPVADEDTEDATDRASIIAKLTEKGIEFDDDNTDEELALILENAE